MNQPNFRCPETDECFFIPTYKTVIIDGQVKYKDKFNKILVNPKNSTELVRIEKEFNWEQLNFTIGTGSDRSGIEKRKNQLIARSKKHFKKEIEEQKVERNRDLVKKFKGE